MYTIKEKHKNFEKSMAFVWTRVIECRGDAPTVVQGFANPGQIVSGRIEHFGGIEYALNFLNNLKGKEAPDYVKINGIESGLTHWFNKES